MSESRNDYLVAAAVAFRESLVPRADRMEHGQYPLWNGWAIYDAFVAGAQYATQSESRSTNGPLKLDTERQVFFYEQEFYVLSNFSSFRLRWAGLDFDSSEHVYHWERFNGYHAGHQSAILRARSAHDAFRYAQAHKSDQRPHWDEVKVNVMRQILRRKAEQHEYVRRKLLETGDRELVENSWRDPFWGWGQNRDGKNMLGVLWMKLRGELREGQHATDR